MSYFCYRDGVLNYSECSNMLNGLLKSKTNNITEEQKESVFSLLDEDKVSLLNIHTNGNISFNDLPITLQK